MVLGTHLDHNFIKLTAPDSSKEELEMDYTRIRCLRLCTWDGKHYSTYVYLDGIPQGIAVKESIEDIKRITREKLNSVASCNFSEFTQETKK